MRFLLLLLGLTATLSAAERPNIIVIMADDMGYGDLSVYGARRVLTPNIDQLAKEGVRFTSGYCTASTCTPTRYSFLTGEYAFRREGTGIAPPNGPAIIPAGTETIASLLKRAGYATAVIGKWHLGLGGSDGPDWNGELRPGPAEIGFDHHFLLPTTNDRVPQVYVTESKVLNLDPADPLWVGSENPDGQPTGITHRDTLKMNWSHGHNQTIHNGISRIGFYTGGHAARFRDEDLGDKWVEQSNEWIEENKDGPFFLFYASHDLHVPRMPHERFHGTSEMGFRGDSIVELDWTVGEIRKTLERLGIAENTLIIFCSDNGPVMDDGYEDGALEQLGSHRAAGPFNGGKYSVYEGGTRTPFITWWPGQIEPAISGEMVSTMDLAASLAAIAGVNVPDNAVPDSMDISGALLGKAGAKGREYLVQQDNGGAGNFGLRFGDWKLVHQGRKSARNTVVEEKLANIQVPENQLFYLPEDPAERHDLAGQNPEVLAKMIAKLEAIVGTGTEARK
jgi:arylsulfatase A-like enzyme